MLQISRRKLLGGLSAFIAAPAIIKVAGIMPVKVWRDPLDQLQSEREFLWAQLHAVSGIPVIYSGYDFIEIGPDDRVTNRA
jgi:hypothetical protein